MSESTFIDENRGKYQPRMMPNVPGKLKYGRTFLIGLAFMLCTIFWEYYNFMMPILLRDFFTDMGIAIGSDTLVGVVMVLDNVVAIFMLPYFGALSDRTKSKHGKRSPYIMIGVSSAIVAFSVMGLLSSSRGVAVFVGLIAVIINNRSFISDCRFFSNRFNFKLARSCSFCRFNCCCNVV